MAFWKQFAILASALTGSPNPAKYLLAYGPRMAYPWYALVGSSTVVIVGLAVSKWTTPAEPASRADATGQN